MEDYKKRLVSSKNQKNWGYSFTEQETQASQYVRKLKKIVRAGIDAKEGEKVKIILEFKKNNPKYADLDILAYINKDKILKRCKSWGIAELLKWSEHKKLHPYTVLSQYSKQCEIFCNPIIWREGE